MSFELQRDRVTRTVYATDNSIYQVEPEAVAVPSSVDDIATILRSNHVSDDRRPIVARGGGTGTNGQSLTDGFMIDLKRNLNRIISIDVETRTAVVEPGVVTAELNAELAEHGLFWAPHTSTLNRATVGGMIATDAAGKGSLVFGRTHRHVVSLEVLLNDGTAFIAEQVSIDEATKRATEAGRVGELWKAILDLPLEQDGDYGLPELARGFSGYGIDRVRRDAMIDPVPLLVGSEGTLGVFTKATLHLTPLPKHTLLIVASYNSFAEALDDAVELRKTAPTAIESFDETTLERGRSSPAWPALGSVVGEHRGSVLLLEYTSDTETPPDPAVVLAALDATGRSFAAKSLPSAVDQAAAWKVRADAVGLLAKVATGGPDRSARPTAMVEDCAVPVAEMGAFIAGFREVLDRAGVEYGMFGHADVGCVHVRPALDTTDPAHERLVRTITDDVVALVAKHGGVLWGEHGRGYRGESVDAFLSSSTINIMRQVKTAFDAEDLLNPGKLYRPLDSNEPLVALDQPPLRGQIDRSVPVEIRRDFDSAFACNGNGLCHHYAGSEVMCPSFKATGDPALSPKGRADLLRSWLANDGDQAEFEDAIAENLHQCLSCSACTGRCPVEVDIPELKSRFLERYYESRKRPPSHRVLGRFEQLASLASRVPQLAELGAGAAGRALGLVDLPMPAKRPKRLLPVFAETPGSVDVVIMPDVFTSVIEPATLHKTYDVLTSLGYTVAVAGFSPSGKFDHVKGNRKAFAKHTATQRQMLERIGKAGATATTIEPAVALLHNHEYPTASSGYPSGISRPLVELILDRRDRLAAAATPQTVSLLGHCTERATAPDWLVSWAEVLTAVGHTVETPALGCCGMAGIFGHEVENQELSKTLWNQTWAPALETAKTAVATGYSCRSQAKRFTGKAIEHPINLL